MKTLFGNKFKDFKICNLIGCFTSFISKVVMIVVLLCGMWKNVSMELKNQ